MKRYTGENKFLRSFYKPFYNVNPIERGLKIKDSEDTRSFVNKNIDI